MGKAAKDFFTKAHTDFEAAKDRCENATAAATAQHKECVVDKEVVEKFYCYMKEGRDKACADYAKGFQDAIDAFKEVKGRVEKTEKINKDHFTQMACSAWVKDTSPPCDILDTAHLDVTYPEEPMQGTCVQIMKFHGRGEHKFQCEETPAPAMEESFVPEETLPEPILAEPRMVNASNTSDPSSEPILPESRMANASNTSESSPEAEEPVNEEAVVPEETLPEPILPEPRMANASNTSEPSSEAEEPVNETLS